MKPPITNAEAAQAMQNAAEAGHYALARLAYALATRACVATNAQVAEALAHSARQAGVRVRGTGCSNAATLALLDQAEQAVAHITGPPTRRWKHYTQRQVRDLMVDLWGTEPL